MQDYGIWTVITPIVTIILAILTRQVMLSLMLGIFVGFTVIHDHNLLLGVQGTVDGIIDTFSSAGEYANNCLYGHDWWDHETCCRYRRSSRSSSVTHK